MRKEKTKEALFVLSERLTRQEIIMKIPDQTAASIVAALNKLERRYGKRFSKIFKSITFDNGSEFADCAGIEKSIYGRTGNARRLIIATLIARSSGERMRISIK